MTKLAALGVVLLVVATVPAAARTAAATTDWPLFGYDSARHNASPDGRITSDTVSRLHRLRVELDGTVDSSPIFVGGRIVFTTTYGRTEAMSPANGKILWRFTPPSYASMAGTSRITNSSPAASTDRRAVYASSPDGRIRKLRLSDGKVLWTTRLTRDPTHEKLTASINVSRGRVIMTTGGYIGDAPPYQGHVVTLTEQSGRILHVWNSLCSDRKEIILPSSCSSSDSAIWSRNGAAVDPSNGQLLVATGNGPWNGRTDWGDSMLVLAPDASRLVRHWTPTDQAQLNATDGDLGTTSPGLLAGGYGVQGGKDAKIRLLELHSLPGVNTKLGGELQTVAAPGNTAIFGEPAIWKGTWAFFATGGGTEAWLLRNGRLHTVWSNRNDGTSPVVAGSLLYVAGQNAVRVYVAPSGRQVASLPTGPVHWQSPIVAAGRVIIAEGNANDHRTNGVLDIFG